MTELDLVAPTRTGEIHGGVSGAGAPLLLLHGGPGFTDYLGSMMAGELAGWRAVHYQQRGLAPSTTSGPFTVGQHVADAIAVLDAAGLSTAVVLGHSWGGHLALQLAVAAPERVAGLALIDPLGAAGDDGGTADVGRALGSRLSAAAASELAQLQPRLADPDQADAAAAEQLSWLWPGYFAVPHSAPPFPGWLRVSVASYAEGMASVVASLAGGFAAAVRQISCPAVLVLGAASPMPLTQGERTAALLADADVVVVPEAGHLPWHERPGCIASALADLRRRCGLDLAGEPG